MKMEGIPDSSDRDCLIFALELFISVAIFEKYKFLFFKWMENGEKINKKRLYFFLEDSLHVLENVRN